jgi:hypothetical protein
MAALVPIFALRAICLTDAGQGFNPDAHLLNREMVL